jgi:hypothetical protein
VKCDTLIKHKVINIVYEESGPINVNYNVLPTTLETNVITKLVVHVVTTKALYTCINCGKTGHILDTCYITEREKFRYYQHVCFNIWGTNLINQN